MCINHFPIKLGKKKKTNEVHTATDTTYLQRDNSEARTVEQTRKESQRDPDNGLLRSTEQQVERDKRVGIFICTLT